MIPFWTFTRKNIELQLRTLRRNPGMQINQLKPFRLRSDEQEQMTKWEAGALAIRLNRDGKTVHMLTGIDLPMRNMDTLWKGGFGATGRNLMGMLSPLLKAPVEAVLNRDLFLNKDLTRKESGSVGRLIEVARTPQPIKDWLGYKKVLDDAGRPRYTFDGKKFKLLLESWMFSRFISTGDRVFREYTRDRNIAGAMLDVATGVRDKQLDLDEEHRRVLHRRIRQLKETLAARGAADPVRVFSKPDTEGL
jgi:hypothetical protein